MTRSFNAAALALCLLASPVLAHAEPEAAKVVVTHDSLSTAAGRDAVAAEIAKAADAYCRANPVGHTVAGCRADVIKQLTEKVAIGARQYAVQNNIVLAGR